MESKLLITSLVSMTVLASCASHKEPFSNNGGLIEREINISEADRTQRNLNTPWSQRRYLSGTKSYIAEASSYRRAPLGSSRHGLIQRNVVATLPLSEKKKPAIDKSPIMVAVASPQGHPVSFTLADFDDSPMSEKKRIESDLSVVYTVPFARRVDVLGPKGRQRTTDLIEIAKNADRVILQGVVSGSGSTNTSHMDSLSLGRAIRIRRYMTRQGIDRKNITILSRDNTHFRPSKNDGNYVEVRIDA